MPYTHVERNTVCSSPSGARAKKNEWCEDGGGGGCRSVKKSASPADGEGPTSRQAQWEGLFYNRTHNPEAPAISKRSHPQPRSA
ncbi:MAG: hypothetical protein IIX64_00725 [Bacteroidales bacterium]|nr:hypothetical protein [Bacteroidales bacterium]